MPRLSIPAQHLQGGPVATAAENGGELVEEEQAVVGRKEVGGTGMWRGNRWPARENERDRKRAHMNLFC